jgi:hypothetical protein
VKFALALSKANENGIAIDGVDETEGLMIKAVETVDSNTAAALPDGPTKEPFLALVLWTIEKILDKRGLDARIYCLNRLHEMAPTALDKARLLLLSQCDPSRPDEFMPRRNADWPTIGDATILLQHARNMKVKETKEFVEQLKRNGRYEAVLGK